LLGVLIIKRQSLHLHNFSSGPSVHSLFVMRPHRTLTHPLLFQVPDDGGLTVPHGGAPADTKRESGRWTSRSRRMYDCSGPGKRPGPDSSQER